MVKFVAYARDQRLLLPLDLTEWVAEDDLAHFIIEAVERVDISHFEINWRGTGKAQYHPRMMLALLIYCYANGIFSSRRIERATHRDIAVRYVAANTHPDHDTIAAFRRRNRAAIAEAFKQVLLLGRELGLLQIGMVSIDGTKLDDCAAAVQQSVLQRSRGQETAEGASKINSVRYDRLCALEAQLEADIKDLMDKAEATDGQAEPDGQALPENIARLETLRAKLDAAKSLLEERTQTRTTTPPPERQINLTDPDSSLMRKSCRHEFRQAYNAQAVVDADGSQLVLAVNIAQTPGDTATFEETINELAGRLGQPTTILADAGYASQMIVGRLEDRGIEMLVATGQSSGERKYDFRPPKPDAKPPRKPKAEWRRNMQQKLQTDQAKEKYRKRKSTVEPVFGIIKNVLGFLRFSLRGLNNVKNEWNLVTLAYNCKRIAKLKLA